MPRYPIVFVMGPSGVGKTTAITNCQSSGLWLKISASSWIKARFPQKESESRQDYSHRLSVETSRVLAADPTVSCREIQDRIDDACVSAERNGQKVSGVILDGVRNPLDFVGLHRKGDFSILSSGDQLTTFETLGLDAIRSVINFRHHCLSDNSFCFVNPFELLKPLEETIKQYDSLRTSG
jgi:hypothetical protein